MSSVSYMEKLLDGVEVEWKTLGDIGNFIRGSGIQKSDFTESGVGCIHYGQIHTHYGTWAVETKSFINPEFAARLRKANTGDLVIATTSEDDAAVAKAVAWLGDEEVAVSTDAYIYRHTINPKYMSYFFQTELFQSQKKPHITGTKVRRISGDSLAKIKIPIPCPKSPEKSLAIQAEIVCILDAFTELTVELTAELMAELTVRKKQYTYYRDRLLTFAEGEVEWKPLGEEFPFIRNGFVGTVTPFFTNAENGVRYLQGTNIHNGVISDNAIYHITKDFHQKCSRTELKADDILMVQSGHVGESAVVGEKYKGSNCHALIVMSNGGKCNSKFVNYYFQSTEGKNKLKKITTGGTVKHILASKMKQFIIPVPPLAKQNRIVAILDKFDALTNSISEGLPHEIALRQQKYVYYREQLLSFPKITGES